MKRLILLFFVFSSIVAFGQRRYLGIPAGAATPSSYTALVAGDLPAGSSHYWLTTGTSTLAGNVNITGTTFNETHNVKGFTVSENGNGLFFNENGGGMYFRGLGAGGIFIGHNSGNNGGINLQDNNAISITSRNSSGLSRFNFLIDGRTSNAAVFTDFNASPEGLKYGADYSATYVTRSLVDKGYVDGVASGISTGSALSVYGRASNTSGANASIVATNDFEILRRSGTSIGFGSINLASANAVGSSILPIANGGTGSPTQNFIDTSTAQTGLTGNKTTSGLWTWSVSSGVTPITVTRTANFSVTNALTTWNNNTSTLVSDLSSNGVQNWILYNSSGTRVGAMANSFTANGPIIAMNNAGITTRFDIRYNGTNNNLVLLNNTNNLNTHVVVGVESAKIGGEMFLTRGDQNTGTYAAVVNATNNTAAYAGFVARAGAANFTDGLQMVALPPAFSGAGMNQASSGLVSTFGTYALGVGTAGAQPTRFYTNNVLRGQYLSTGEFLTGPSATTLISSETVQVKNDQNALTYALIHNATNNTGANSALFISAGVSNQSSILGLRYMASSFTTSGMFEANKAIVYGAGAAGLNIGTADNSAPVHFYTNGSLVGRMPSGGGLAIGPNSLSADAILEAQSTTKGFRPSKMTTTQRDAIVTPGDGLMISNSTLHTIDYHNGTSWVSLTAGGIGGSTGATDNAVLRADGTGGNTAQASAISISDAVSSNVTISTIGSNHLSLLPGGGGLNYIKRQPSGASNVPWPVAVVSSEYSGTVTTGFGGSLVLDSQIPAGGTINAGTIEWKSTDLTASAEKFDIIMSPLRGAVKTTTAFMPQSYTVTTLPASPQQGWLVVVTDSNTTTFNATIAGGGSNVVLALYDGTNWKVH